MSKEAERKFVCTNCCERLNKLSEIEWDHIHALALGGAHDAPNITPLCKPCHKLKTFGTKSSPNLTMKAPILTKTRIPIRICTKLKRRKSDDSLTVEREGGKEKLRNRNIFSPGLTVNILYQVLVMMKFL